MTCIIQPTRATRSLSRLVLVALVAGALLVSASATHAKQTPEQTCQKGRYEAAARYAVCQQKAMGAYYGGGKIEKFQEAVGKCTVKYTATWPKLQKKAIGTGVACAAARFVEDETTVTDNLTGLQWEKKQNMDDSQDFTDPHDADNYYSWSANGSAENGTAFTNFLLTLNSGGCFAGQCGWRLPTFYELQTILKAPYPCATSPCIDPIFGPTVAGDYWTATTFATYTVGAWVVLFSNGVVFTGDKRAINHVRAVRAGL